VGRMGQVSMTVPAVQERTVEEWVDDVRWHRRMYRESHFRWAPEDPALIFLDYTRGRCVFETPAHLRFLDARQERLQGWMAQIRNAMAKPLREARTWCPQPVWNEGLKLIGLTERDVRIIIGVAGVSPDPSANRDVKRALRGFPLPNPFTQVWELRQMHAMYQAADNMMEDTLVDLLLELEPRRGWDNLADFTVCGHPEPLKTRVKAQRAQRGELGDPRRLPAQHY